MTNQNPLEIDNSTGEALPISPNGQASRYRADLSTSQQIRKEMSKIYRESRSGLLPTNDLTKLIYSLNLINRVLETGDLEQRLEKLESEAGA